MKLNVFDGGLNTRLADILLPPVQAKICTNVDTSTGVIKSAKDVVATSTTVDRYAYWYNNTWVSSATTREYLEYQNVLYWTEEGSNPKKFDGTTLSNLGIAKPTNKPTVALGGAGNLDGVYQYVYTFYNINDGTESAPSDVSVEITVTNRSVNLSAIQVSADPQVTHVKIYRVGGNYSDFFEVGEIANGTTTFNDNLADTNIVGSILESENNGNPPSGLRYLTGGYGVFFGAVGPRLYFTTDEGNPNYWPSTLYIDFYDDITGIAEVYSGILVFTYYETYYVSGTTPTTFVKHRISADQGCISNESIQSIGSAVIFVSTDGICSSNGSKVNVDSKNSLAKQNLSIQSSVLHDEVYYLVLVDQTILAFDRRYTPNYVNYDLSVDALFIDDTTLYAWRESTGLLYAMFASAEDLTYTYKTGKFVDSAATDLKSYNNFYIRADGEHAIDIIIDDEVVMTTILKDQLVYDITVPQYKQLGYSVQFQMTGKGSIYEIEYKPLSRQNGR